MKRKVLSLLIATIMIFSLTACNSDGDNQTGGSQSRVNQQTNSKKYLKDLGWVAFEQSGLGFYLPDEDYDKENHDDENPREESTFMQYYLGYDDEYGVTVIEILKRDLGNSVISEDSIEFIVSSLNKDDIELKKEDDSLFIYGNIDKFVGDNYVFVFPKGEDFYYKIYVNPELFDEFDTFIDFYDGGEVYEKGRMFTDESFDAFIDTLTYLGN